MQARPGGHIFDVLVFGFSPSRFSYLCLFVFAFLQRETKIKTRRKRRIQNTRGHLASAVKRWDLALVREVVLMSVSKLAGGARETK